MSPRRGMHGFLLALLATGVAAFGSLPAAHPGNPCLDPEDFVATNSIDAPHCVGDEPPNPIAATQAACEAASCEWDAGNNDDPCHCDHEQLCESATVGGTWTPRSLTCGGAGSEWEALVSSWTCASNPNEVDYFAGLCCSSGVASSKCNCEGADCAFNPCMDPEDFVPANAIPSDHCEGDEPPNPIAATQAACEAASCDWDAGNNDDPCHCNSEQLCESATVGGTWTPRSLTCGGSSYQAVGSSWTCASNPNMDYFAGLCCSGGEASSKCA